MANIETASTVPSTTTSPDGKESAIQQSGEVASATETLKESGVSTTTTASSSSVSAPSSATATPTQTQLSGQPARPSLVPLGSSQSSISTTTAHPKKFSAVNVNKKFLEKTAQAASASASSASSSAKASAAVARPVATPTTSHSRLVTTKLTATPAPSTAGWSRPTSVAPSSSTANNSPNSTSPLPTAATIPNSSAAPQLPHVGKVIQPQPKSAASSAAMKETYSVGKPVWGNVKPPSAPVRLDIPTEDFPTAAEVAQISSNKKSKSEDSKSPVEVVKQARSEDADAFRGVHLDPNAHHWDEMEEDDDDFLGKPVEFEDGRQYKVESVDGRGRSASPGAGPKSAESTEKVRDRFADDYDRSWPRSKPSPAMSSHEVPPFHDITRSPSGSVNGLHPSSSPVESSRVLFNERSNRLEPYNRQPSSSKRPGFHDTEGRGARDFSGPSQNVQVLHKPSNNEFGSRNRRFSGASNGSAVHSPRDGHFPRRDGPPPSPRMSRDGSHAMSPSMSQGGRDRDSRRGSMGPPPVPPHALKSAQESGRPLPPHLTQYPPSRRESWLTHNEPPTPGSLKAPSLPSQSPLSVHAQLSAVSPVIGTLAGLPLPLGTDLEEARKDVMHSAAARAKQRREQEEAEREAQKERARRKAQEIEERMKASQSEKEKEQNEQNQKKTQDENDIVDSIINDAVKSAHPVESQPAKPEVHASKPSRPPGEPFPGKRPSTIPSKPSAPPEKADSWRSNITSVPGPPLQQRKSSSGFVASSTVALDAAVDTKKEDLEVVDFSDLGKLVDGPRSKDASEKPAQSRPPRPVASDFFDDKKPSPEREMPEPVSWRRKAPDAQEQTTSDQRESNTPQERQTPPTKDHGSSPNAHNFVEQSVPSGTAVTKDSSTYQDGRQVANMPHPPSGPPRTPRSQTFYKEYKEATMSSLDDTMSRIKGAIVHMKSHEAPSSDTQPEQVQTKGHPAQNSLKPPFREKWVPPARRLRSVGFAEDEDREVFDVTVITLPCLSPPPVPSVRLPKQSRPVEFIHRGQLQRFHRPSLPVRFDILTFEPPVEGMNKRDLSVNNVLFRRPMMVKGKPKYHVSLPRSRTSKGLLRGFGKPAAADTSASWRKPAASSTTNPTEALLESSEDTGLNTMSRSPPPELATPETNIASIPKPTESIASRVESHPAARSRPQPKMPAGSAVAVRRDSRIDVIEANVIQKTSVNFIVSDELEEDRESAQTVEVLPVEAPTTISLPTDLSPPTQNLQPIAKPVSTPQANVNQAPLHEPSLLVSQPETKPSDNANMTERSPFKSSNHQSLPWSTSSLNVPPPLRESTSRGPDPEHLKALWSQPEPSDKAELHPVNSLEGIADDLTSLPFTLHEVKSEDGSTPPPQGAAPQPPSRMSLHDVRRAFQQVPQSSSSSSTPSRAPISPPFTNAPVARPTYPYNTLPPNGMRPPYPSYPSPVTSHSPAPGMGMMYPHPHPPPPMASASPIPSRMQVNSIYPPPQSMWVPVMGPSPPNASGMIRPVAYPAPGQVMPYSPSAPPSNPIYSQHVGAPPNQPSSNPVQGNRNRNMSGMSPALSHAPMYPTSPMMMHAHAHSPAMQGHGYAPLPAGRGQPRSDHAHLGPQQHLGSSQPQSHVMYPSAAPAAPFTRSGW